jgi:methylsterol monooxygenase
MPLKTTLPLPGALKTIGTYLFCLVWGEIGFYYVHRILHEPPFYKHLHKMHHGILMSIDQVAATDTPF